jgi:hypothetical protein
MLPDVRYWTFWGNAYMLSTPTKHDATPPHSSAMKQTKRVRKMLFVLHLATLTSPIYFSGSTVAVIVAASILSFCGAIAATFVTYLDL